MSDSADRPDPDQAASETAQRALETGPRPAAPGRGWGPAALLRPEREVVAFTGRDAERSLLRDWCAGMAPHSVRVVVGAAGVGKTRLVRQVAADWGAQAEPWRVVQPGDEPHAAAAARVAGPGRPLLIVDEAESRDDGLAALLDTALAGPGEARVLLVARSLGDWWDLLLENCAPGVARVLSEAPPVRLGGPLGPGLSDAEVAVAAVPYFAAAMSVDLPGRPQVERSALRLPVLLLHAAALLAVLRSAADPRAPFRVVIGQRVLDELLGHEVRYWQDTAAAAGLANDTEPVTHAVTVATLAGPRGLDDAGSLLARVPHLTGVTREERVEWAQWLCGLYPPGPNGRIGSLRPDSVAQTLVVRQLAGDPVLARRFLRGLPPDQAVHAVAVLGQAAGHEPAATGVLAGALHYDLPRLAAPAALVAQQVPGALPSLLRDALRDAPAEPQTLAAIARGLPRISAAVAEPELITILRARESLAASGSDGLAEWDDKAADVLRWLDGRELAQPGPGTASGPPGWSGDPAGSPGEPPGWSGEPHGAGPPGPARPGAERFGAGQCGAGLDRAGREGGGHAELASALSNLAVRYSERDRPPDAQRAEQLAVRIYRDLDRSEPGRYRPELAASLVNLGVWAAAATGPADAVAPTREAAGILRDLAADDPGHYLPDLATCLANLGVWYGQAGQSGDALSAEKESASILRRLALDDPGRYQAELAASLTNLGISYSRAGRPEQAVPVEQETVAIRRELTAADPGPNAEGLASSLTNLAITLAEVGLPEDAAQSAEEAVSVYRELAATNPGRHRRDLARALASLGIRQRELGRPDAAAESLSEAVSIRRALAATGPGHSQAALARALASLAAALAELGRTEEADAALAEAEALGVRSAAPQACDARQPTAADQWRPPLPEPRRPPAAGPDPLTTGPLTQVPEPRRAEPPGAEPSQMTRVPEPRRAGPPEAQPNPKTRPAEPGGAGPPEAEPDPPPRRARYAPAQRRRPTRAPQHGRTPGTGSLPRTAAQT